MTTMGHLHSYATPSAIGCRAPVISICEGDTAASRTRLRLDGCDLRRQGARSEYYRDDQGQDNEPELVRSSAHDMRGRYCCCSCDARGFGVSGGLFHL